MTARGRVLWIHQNFVASDQPGNGRAGAQIDALVEAGFEVDLVTSQQGYLERSPRALEDEVVSRPGWRLHRLALGGDEASFATRRLGYVRFVLRSLHHAFSLPRPTIVFASSPPLPQLVPALLVSAYHRAPLVVELRDLWPAFLEELGLLRSRPMILAMRWLEAIALRYGKRFIAVTPGFAGLLELQGVPASALCVLPTGANVPTDATDSERAAMRAAWRRACGIDDRWVVLYAGSLNEHYAIDEIIGAARHLAQRRAERIEIVVCGDGRMREAIEAEAKALRGLRYLGPLPRAEMAGPLAGADLALVTLSPTPLFEAVFPGKLFEALMAGLPPLTNIEGHAEELVRASGGGWAIPGAGGEQLADEILRLSELPEREFEEKRRAARTFARSRLDAVRLARELPAWMPPADDGAGPGRLLLAALQGAFDVATGRNTRYRRLPPAERKALITRRFEAWLSAASGSPARGNRRGVS